MKGRHRDFTPTTCPPTCTVSPFINIPNWVVHLLQRMNWHWHITITSSPWFMLEFTLAVYSLSLNKCIIRFIYHHHVLEYCNSSKSSLLCLFIPPSPYNPWPPVIFLLSYSFTFSRTSYVGIIQYITDILTIRSFLNHGTSTFPSSTFFFFFKSVFSRRMR